MKEKIIEELRKLDFVEWDRYFGYEKSLTFFGWIDRKDQHKDFVYIEFENGVVLNYGTSSKRHTSRIAQFLKQSHSECKRVEDFCDLSNVIRLKDKKR